MDTPLLIIGAVLLALGAALAIGNRKNWLRRKRILDTPTSPIAQASGQGEVEIKGTIMPGEQGFIQAPFSGRYVLWYRALVQELRSSGKNSYWHTVLTEVDSRPFFVDDGSGQLARVLPHGANVVLDRQNIASSGTFNDAAPHLEAFLMARGIKSTGLLGFNKSMRYEEEVLGPNEPLYALGPSRRDPGPPVHDGYRMVPGTQLVLFHGLGQELILTNKGEDELTAKLGRGFIAGLVLVALGILTGLSGMVVAVVDHLELVH